MNEAKQYDEADLSPLPELNNYEQLTPPLDRDLQQGNTPPLQEGLNLPIPEEVLHKVTRAAEHNQAIEKLFELSHEVKDFIAPPAQHSAAPSSIGQVLESRTQTYGSSHQNIGTNQPKKAGLWRQTLTSNSLYGQAIRYGFASAALALLSATLIVILFT